MSASETPPSSDRRQYRRYALWFPVTLDVGGRAVRSICRDVSRRGILVSARQLVAGGTAVTVRFHLTPNDPKEHEVPARVVRCEQNENELGLAFPFRLAIQFDAPDEALGAALEHSETLPHLVPVD
jgi:PilZ domain